MSVISCELMTTGNTGEIDASYQRSYKSTYRVETDSILDREPVVLLAPGLPLIYDRYVAGGSYDLGSLCKGGVARPTIDPFVWEVDVSYESWAKLFGLDGRNPKLEQALADTGQTMQQGASIANDPSNPIDRPSKIKFGWRKYQKLMRKDLSGAAVVNSAGLPIELVVDDTRPLVTISKRLATMNAGTLVAYQDSINSDVFLGQPAYSAKISITADENFENKTYFFDVTYEIEFRRELWFPELVLDQGTMFFDSLGDGKWHVILDPLTAMPVTGPVLLNGAGAPSTSNPPTPYFLQFDVYKRLPFAPLNLP